MVASSAEEAELGTLFLNAKEAKILRFNLEEIGHKQLPTPIHVDNSTTVEIVNNTIKRQKFRSMEMRYFWLLDGSIQNIFDFSYQPGLEKLADYPSKHHPGSHYTEVHPYYVHMHNSTRYLVRADKPSVRQGCVLPAKSGTYSNKHPLPAHTRVGRQRPTRVGRTRTDSAHEQ